MKNIKCKGPLLLLACFFVACHSKNKGPVSPGIKFSKGSYGYDADLLRKHKWQIFELFNGEGARVLLSSDDQGRVMTSSAAADSGTSFGWLNYNQIDRGLKRGQFNAIGGEERFWLGPEGGQYSVFFNEGDSFTIENWHVPDVINSERYDLVSIDSSQASFSTKAELVNYSGTGFSIQISRTIELFDRNQLQKKLGLTIPAAIKSVAYQSDNTIKNIGYSDWSKKTGLFSIWLLGMMTPTPETKVMIPFSPQSNARSLITDNYFGRIPADRLLIKDSVLYLKCDGKSRGKIGISPLIAKPLAASFDFKRNILTLVIPEITKSADYVNSKWELQKQPYKGDVINAYNDGPLKDGSQLGPFYEIESSSPAVELKQNEEMIYHQVTAHLQGDYKSLRTLVQSLLHIDLNELRQW